MKLLIADDDPQLLRALRITLTAKGYDVATAATGREAIDSAASHRPDVIILDLGMPEFGGLDVIHAVRGWSDTPILVVSGRTGSADKVEALDAGADDYVTKPFAIEELLARVRALTRRAAPHDVSPPTVTLGAITIDVAAHSVMRNDRGPNRVIRLTPTEWRVIELLARHPGSLVTRQTLLASVWGSEHVTDTGYLRLYVSQLRKKLEPEPRKPRYLVTEAGMGYRLIIDGDAENSGKNDTP